MAILARGQRLADIREHGVVLEDMFTERQTVARVRVMDELAAGDAYDWVLLQDCSRSYGYCGQPALMGFGRGGASLR